MMPGLLEGEDGGICPRSVILTVGADHFNVFRSDVGFLVGFPQRTFDRALAVGGGASRNASRAAFRAPDRTMLHDDMCHLAGLFIASGQ